jgi:hypothetical protein
MGEDVEKRESVHTVDEVVNDYSYYGTQCELPQKIKNSWVQWYTPVIPATFEAEWSVDCTFQFS